MNNDYSAEYKIELHNSYSFNKLKEDVFTSYRNINNIGFNKSNIYEDFGEMFVMHVNEHVLDYYYLIKELSKNLKVIMLGEDFGLSHVSYLSGLSNYYHFSQLKTNIEYGQFWPLNFNLGIERNKATKLKDALHKLGLDNDNMSGTNEIDIEVSKNAISSKNLKTLSVDFIDTTRFRLLTDNKPDYSDLPFPEIKADTIYDLVGDETNVYLIGEDSAKLIEPLLALFKPGSFAELEQVCSLLLASKETAETIIHKKESGFEHWASYLSRESFARFIYGIDGYYEDAVWLMARMRRGIVNDNDIANLKSIGTSDDVIHDILAIRHIARRSYAADLARIVWRSQLEKNAITELYDFRPFSEGLHMDVREHKILDRIPCTEEGMKAVKDYLKRNDSCQARERLRKISEELSRRRFAGI